MSQGPAASASPGRSAEMQNLRLCPDLLDQTVHLNPVLRRCMYLLSWEDLSLSIVLSLGCTLKSPGELKRIKECLGPDIRTCITADYISHKASLNAEETDQNGGRGLNLTAGQRRSVPRGVMTLICQGDEGVEGGSLTMKKFGVLNCSLLGWEGGSRGNRHMDTWLVHLVVQQKWIQHCKAIIPQVKKNFFKIC